MTQPWYIVMTSSIKWIKTRYKWFVTTRVSLRTIRHPTSTSINPLFKNSNQNNKTLKSLLSKMKNLLINERPFQLADKSNNHKNVVNTIKPGNNYSPHSKRRWGSKDREKLSLKQISKRTMISSISTLKSINVALIMTSIHIINTGQFPPSSLVHHWAHALNSFSYFQLVIIKIPQHI